MQPFQLVGGHAALDLVNTLDWRFRDGQPEDLIAGYGDVVRFVVQSGLMSATEGRRLVRSAGTNKAAQVVAETRGLREAAARVFYAALDDDDQPVDAIRDLEGYFKDAEAHRKLRWSERHLRWEFPAALAAPELPLWILSLKTAQLITSGNMEMVRACGNPECRWLFLDTSKNHTRRWCDMKICGNRMKARRFKAHHG
ncbi:MAG TPA: CGNR zinc finger domain-containing protein [Terracidiphilus sp.]